jgi:suppressor of ftsI
MKRRLLVILLACACIVGCRGSSALTPNTVPGAPGTQSAPNPQQERVSPDTNVNELPEPPVVKAVNGVATVELIANINPATGLPAFQYDGVHGVAPTIDVKPGQKFIIDISNDLLPAGKKSLMNLHFHGLGSSPKRPGDDVLGVESKPGQKLHYEVTIPKNQPPGLYWYHPHIHGETSYQVGEGGMSGAILVEGLEKHFPALAKMRQRIVIVRATGVGINAVPQDDDMGGMPMPSSTTRPLNSNTHPCSFNDHLTVTLNGAYQPLITIAPGEKQFIRLINATGHKPLNLNVQGGTMQVVAIDGYALDTYPGTGPTETVTNLLVPVAARAEFIITGAKSGHTRFRALCYNTGPDGDPDVAVFLAHMQSAAHGSHGGYFSNEPLRVGAPLPQNVYTEKLPAPSATRLVVFSEDQKPHFFLNGKSFHMNSPPMFVVHTGTTELWHLRNVTQEDHDFHIHQLHFLVLRKNGIKLQHPYWADSVQLPHRYMVGTKAVDGSLDVLMNFMDPIIKGEFLFHCHIMDHEDEGMMAKIVAI